jgi:hypothetical protein
VPEQSRSLPAEATDVWQLLVAYAKQETIEEIKPIGRFVIWGVAGSLLLSLGLVLLTLSALRALQTETGSVFQEHLSWIPYVITLVGAGALAALSGRAISARNRRD